MSLKMKDPKEMDRADLAALVNTLQHILFWSDKGLDPHKEWNSDSLCEIGELIDKYGLRPIDAQAVARGEIAAASLKFTALVDRLREVFVPGNEVFSWYRQIETHLLNAQNLLKTGGS